MIKIDNLNEGRELDTEAAEVRGGMLPFSAANFLASYRENLVSVAGLNFSNLASNGSAAQIAGPVNITNVVGTNQITTLGSS